MKLKVVWLLALCLGAVCVWTTVRYWQQQQPKSIIGIQKSAIVLAHNQHLPLYFGDLSLFGDLGLQLTTKPQTNLAEAVIGQTVRYNDFSYTQVQPGLYLVQLGNERIFIFTDPFTPDVFDLKIALAFKSDWTVLQRSSLLPNNWPQPRLGWIVLGSQMSDRLKTESLESTKPVVMPESQGTIWLIKTPASSWELQKP